MIFVLLFVLPLAVEYLSKKVSIIQKAGSVTVCYGLGFIISLLPISYNKDLLQTAASIIIAITIPLILFGFDIREVRKLAKETILSFVLLIITVMTVSTIASVIGTKSNMQDTAKLAGMATGLYVGGTPNMFAIGNALNCDMTTINMVNISDTLFGGIFFFALISFINKIYKALSFKKDESEIKVQKEIKNDESEFSLIKLVGVVLLAILCLGIGALIEFLVNGNIDGSLFIILTVSVLGVVFGLFKNIREVKGSYQLSQYLTQVFSLGLGMSIDFSKLINGIVPVLIFFSLIQVVSMLIHFVLCRIFKISGGTAFITYIAGIYGPPFIIPAANSYKDKSLILPGFICGTLGLVIGNILGITLFKILTL